MGNKRLLTEAEADEHPGIARVHRWFADMHELEWEGDDISVEKYLRGKGANDEEIQLAEGEEGRWQGGVEARWGGVADWVVAGYGM